MKSPRQVSCPYCKQPAELVSGRAIYPHRRDLFAKMFWRCEPCGAWVGTHLNSPDHAPLGRLANKELRDLKMRVHALFDPHWKHNGMSRSAAYRWLAEGMGISKGECHVGMFSEDKCRRALDFLTRPPDNPSVR